MTSANDNEIRALSPGLLNDYLAFFDHDAFSDNPRWASCYCHFNHALHEEKPWKDRGAGENRSAVSGRIAGGGMRGYLAYVDGKPVGWCNACPRSWITTLEGVPLAGPPEKTGCIICFVIARPFRGQGLATRLLEAACEGFRREGFEYAEGLPPEAAGDDAANHHGTLSMFLKAGFERVDARYGVVLVRRKLQP
jgi:GNAT superfamily N-acetyltransferase